MILSLKTSGAMCEVWIGDRHFEWEAGRDMARGLLGFLRDCLTECGTNWSDISGIEFFEGPGSFTSLRIGVTIANTLADSENIPIVGARGDNWRTEAEHKLLAGEDHKVVLPFYGAEANISKSRK